MDKNSSFKQVEATPSNANGLDGKFRKSSKSAGGNCVEVAKNSDGTVHVRDTKDRKGLMLTFTSSEWTAFLAGVREGEFDL